MENQLIKTKVVVTGANGFLGKALMSKLSQVDGVEVAGWVRSIAAVSNGNTSENLNFVEMGDLSSTPNDMVLDKLSGVSVVIHLAGVAHVGSKGLEGTYDSSLAIAQRLFENSNSAGVKLFINMSSIAARLINDTNDSGLLQYGRFKLSVEEYLSNFVSSNRQTAAVSLRPPAIVGVDARGSFEIIQKLILKGIPLPFGGISTLRPYLSLENLCLAVEKVVTEMANEDFGMTNHKSSKPSHEIYEIYDGENKSVAQVAVSLGRQLRKSVRIFSVPPFLLKLALSLAGRKKILNSLFATFKMNNESFENRFGRFLSSSADG